MLRAIPLLSALALLLSSTSQAALVSAAPASLPPATSENAYTAFLIDGSESRIGLLCHNDPVNKSDPTGLDVGLDSQNTPLERIIAFVLVARIASTPEGAQALSDMAASPHDFTYSVMPANLAPAGSLTVQDGEGGAKMLIRPYSIENTRSDGTTETVPASVGAAHETGHGASIAKGTQPAEDGVHVNPNMRHMDKPSETGSDALKVEDAVRKLEGLKERNDK